MNSTGPPPHAFDIRPLDGSTLDQVPALQARCLGFGEVDQTPPWLLDLIARNGGITLGAFQGAKLVGYSLSFPGQSQEGAYLAGLGLGVDPKLHSRGVGVALMEARRQHALAAGYRVLRWTTNSLASAPLYLYLNKLGARLDRLHPNMYRDTQKAKLPDEVGIEWRPEDRPATRRDDPPPIRLTASTPTHDGLRKLCRGEPLTTRPSRAAYLVEIPWDRHELLRRRPDDAVNWSRGVRDVIQTLLGAGYVGTHVLRDTAHSQSFVQFERADRPA